MRIPHMTNWWKISSLALLVGSITFIPQAQAKLKVMTTFVVLQDMVQNVAGDYAEVQSLTGRGAEIHDFEPTSRDLVKLNNVDVIITNGLNLEVWFQRFYDRATQRIPTFVASQGVVRSLITSGPYKGKANPHGWMSIKNAYIYVSNIAKALCTVDQAHCTKYQENAQKYTAQISKIDTRVTNFLRANQLVGKYLITSESAFSYLARDIGLRYDSIWPVNSDEAGTPKQLVRIIDIIRKENIKVVFSGSTMDIKPMEVVMRDTDAVFGGYLYVDTLTEPEGRVPTYLAMLERTVYAIVDGYQKVVHK